MVVHLEVILAPHQEVLTAPVQVTHPLEVQARQEQSQQAGPIAALTPLRTVFTATLHSQTAEAPITRIFPVVRHMRHFTHTIDQLIIIIQLGIIQRYS